MATPEIRKVKIWIHAFIPRDIPGLTEELKRPAMRGMTIFRTELGCGLTDQREFSTDIQPTYRLGSQLRAAYRLHSEIEIDTSSDSFVQYHNTGRSVEVYCGALTTPEQSIPTPPPVGAILSDSKADVSGLRFDKFRMPRRVPGVKEYQFEVHASKAAGLSGVIHPLLKLGSYVKAIPAIDYNGDFIVTIKSHGEATIIFKGYVDLFPAYEMYVSINRSVGIPLFRVLSVPGTSPITGLSSTRPIFHEHRLALTSRNGQDDIEVFQIL